MFRPYGRASCEIVQCGEPAFAWLRRASARQASLLQVKAVSPEADLLSGLKFSQPYL